MHSLRIRYIVCGMLIYIQSAFSRTCDTPFEDVRSKAILADIIIEAHADGKLTGGSNIDAYNATFSIKRVLKGSLPKRIKKNPVIVGHFGPLDRKKCMTEVSVDSTYVLFLQDKGEYTEPFYKIAGLPETTSKQVLRDIRKIICAKCAKPPKARLIPKDVVVESNQRLQLRCKVRGSPTPVITWYHDDKEIKTSRNVNIRSGKKGSRLRIKKSQKDDSGIYSCKAVNVLGEHRSDSLVSVTEKEGLTPTPQYAVKCSRQTYCLNGGTCYQLPDLGSQFCRCPKKFTGERCQSKDVFFILKEIKSREEHEFDRVMTISGLVLGALVFLSILLVSWCLAKHRRIQYEKKKADRERYKNEVLANHIARQKIPSPANGPIANHFPLAQKPAAPPRVKTSSTQTSGCEEACGGRGRVMTAAGCERPARPPAPPCSPPPPAPPHHTTTVALVESDPEVSRHSSPSQTSKTESAHAGLNDLPHPRGSGPGAAPAAMDLDQTSNYDNQTTASDLEEALQDSVSSCSSSSSPGDAEQALFLHHLNLRHPGGGGGGSGNPRVADLVGHQRGGSQHSGDSSLSWDELGNAPPSFAADHQPLHAFNPYAVDEDIISNKKYLHDLRPPPPRRQSDKNHVDQYLVGGVMYDPDPDATPV